MTDSPVRVMPRVPLVAERYGSESWVFGEGWDRRVTTAWLEKFMVPADAYERLIAAVADLADGENNVGEVCAAYRAYVGE